MLKYQTNLNKTGQLTSGPAVSNAYQQAHNILFASKVKAHNTGLTVQQEWHAYIAEPTNADIDPLTYWEVTIILF